MFPFLLPGYCQQISIIVNIHKHSDIFKCGASHSFLSFEVALTMAQRYAKKVECWGMQIGSWGRNRYKRILSIEKIMSRHPYSNMIAVISY